MRERKSDKAEQKYRMHDLSQMDENTRMIINLRDISLTEEETRKAEGAEEADKISVQSGSLSFSCFISPVPSSP